MNALLSLLRLRPLVVSVCGVVLALLLYFLFFIPGVSRQESSRSTPFRRSFGNLGGDRVVSVCTSASSGTAHPTGTDSAAPGRRAATSFP